MTLQSLLHRRSCACQGFEEERSGASFSFGCAWSMYHNGCKYARSVSPNKFKLSKTKDPVAEKTIENMFQSIATFTGRIYKKLAPDSHSNQVRSKIYFKL